MLLPLIFAFICHIQMADISRCCSSSAVREAWMGGDGPHLQVRSMIANHFPSGITSHVILIPSCSNQKPNNKGLGLILLYNSANQRSTKLGQ